MAKNDDGIFGLFEETGENNGAPMINLGGEVSAISSPEERAVAALGAIDSILDMGSEDEETDGECPEDLSAHSFAALVATNIEAAEAIEREKERKRQEETEAAEEERKRRVTVIVKETICELNRQLKDTFKSVKDKKAILNTGHPLAKFVLKTDESGNLNQGGNIYCNQKSVTEISGAVEKNFTEKGYRIFIRNELKKELFEIEFLIIY